MCDQIYKYKSIVVAKYLLDRANEKHIVINMTKLQKLLFAVYGIYLTENDERIMNESPKAWPYGPVFPTVREKLLNVNLYEYDIEDEKEKEFQEIRKDDVVVKLVDKVLDTFGKKTAGQLTAWSHSNNSPWDRTTRLKGFDWNDTIPDVYIKEDYSRFMRKNG